MTIPANTKLSLEDSTSQTKTRPGPPKLVTTKSGNIVDYSYEINLPADCNPKLDQFVDTVFNDYNTGLKSRFGFPVYADRQVLKQGIWLGKDSTETYLLTYHQTGVILSILSSRLYVIAYEIPKEPYIGNEVTIPWFLVDNYKDTNFDPDNPWTKKLRSKGIPEEQTSSTNNASGKSVWMKYNQGSWTLKQQTKTQPAKLTYKASLDQNGGINPTSSIAKTALTAYPNYVIKQLCPTDEESPAIVLSDVK